MRALSTRAAALCATAALSLGGAGLVATPAHAMRFAHCDHTWLGVRDFWLNEANGYLSRGDINSATVCLGEASSAQDAYLRSCG